MAWANLVPSGVERGAEIGADGENAQGSSPPFMVKVVDVLLL